MSAATKATPRPSPSLRQRLSSLSGNHRSTTVIVGMTIFTVLLFVLPAYPPLSLFQTKNAWIDGFVNAGVFVLLALGLNIVVGFAGLLDLGYAAFFAIGAYVYAYGASPFSGNESPFILMVFVGAGVAMLFGVLLGAPTLRLRGDYLAIVTLGFGEIVPIVFLNADRYTQGTNGIGGIYRPAILGVQFRATDPLPYFVVMAVTVTIVMVLIYRLEDSRIGRAWMAIREDELAAAANGINTVTTKLLAFCLGASTAGIAGVINASKLTLVSPDQFLFTVSFTVLAMVVLGGMGNIWGVAAGAFIIYNIQAVFLKQLNAFFEKLPVHIPILADINFVQYQFLLYGIALVLMMLFRPEGLFPSRRRRRELHAAEELGEDAAGEISGGMGEAPGAEEYFGEEDAAAAGLGEGR
jgi:ABC-type branched-subunit amino acid transport system permease subunit